MTRIKIWYPEELFDKNQRSSWFELIKSKERFERKQNLLDGNIQNQIDWVDSADLADVFLLPHDWGYYYSNKKQDLAIKFCEEAFKKGVNVLSNSGGDQGITVPVPENTLVYRQSGYRSKRKENERTIPFFLSDPVTSLLKIPEESIFQFEQGSPIVGFCGMAPNGLKTEVKERLQIILRNLKSNFKLTYGDPQEVLSSSNIRFKVLSSFEQAKYFDTSYLIRQKYRGGIQTAENRKKTTKEYYDNQLESNLIVCVRGVGNFSLRFFETLAMGRIPIFVDTDSPLPDIGEKNWKDYVIWIDKSEISFAAQVAEKWLANRDIVSQQRLNRQLWVDHFRLDNFWINEFERLNNNGLAHYSNPMQKIKK